MIIEYKQRKDSIDISYVDKNNQIAVEELILENGYYQYVACDEYDPNKIEGLRSFYNSPIKKVPAKYFNHHNINEFFGFDIPLNYKQYHEKFSLLAEPKPFSLDIEVIPTKEHGYSPADEAKNPITSISFTDENLETLLFIVKNEKHPVINDFDISYINGLLAEQLGHLYKPGKFNFQIRIFNSEVEMLNTLLEVINKYFHLIMGWNFLIYDWAYISKRCGNLGIDIKKASPTRTLTKKKIDINDNTSIELQVPAHRVIMDYMLLFKESLVWNNLGSYSLDSISELILNLHKVSYEGNLRTLYETDFLRFIAYSLVDTILVMLIHKKTNLLTIEFFQSYYTGVPFQKLSQNSISEALVYQELKSSNIFLLETEKNQAEKRKYKGGYVKKPIKKIVEAVMGDDYGALYPNSIITAGLSPEAKIDSIKTNDDGYPLNEIENKKWLDYKKLGYCLAPTGRIYDVTVESLYVRIEKKLLKERKIFKGHMEDIYLNILPDIEAEIKRRGLKVPDKENHA